MGDKVSIFLDEYLAWLAKVKVPGVVAKVLTVHSCPHQAAIGVYVDLSHSQGNSLGELIYVYAPR